MTNATTSKRKRKNMNLSAAVFGRMERLKKAQERKLKIPMGWDNFFSLLIEEIERLRKLGGAS